jgi:hypothetical protein
LLQSIVKKTTYLVIRINKTATHLVIGINKTATCKFSFAYTCCANLELLELNNH